MNVPPRFDLVFLALVASLALLLRSWGLGTLGLVHFDEGIYALAGLELATFPPAIAPSLIAYAPPAFPILVGAAFRLLGPSDIAAIGVSIVLGAAAVPLMAALANQAFGRLAGAIAAVFATLWGAHVAFARMALTDATFLFAWVLALVAAARFLDRPTTRRALVAGLAIGLAMNVKYNGWLAGLVLVLAATPSLRGATWRARGALVLALAVAGLACAPWFLFVERHGGYAALLKHQSGYVLGPGAWSRDFRLQLAQVEALSGLPAWAIDARVGTAAFIALVALAMMRPLPVWSRRTLAVVAAVGLLLAPSLVWWVALMVAPWRLFDDRPAARVVSWSWLVLALLTPLYHPYARLWLPLHAAGLVLVAGWLAGSFDPGATRRTIYPVFIACGALVFVWTTAPGRPLPDLLGRSDLLRLACLHAADTIGATRVAVPVLARPSALFHLGPRVPLARFADPGQIAAYFGPSPWLLIDEAQWRQDGISEEARRTLRERWEVAASWPTPLNAPTWLDADPGAATRLDRSNHAELVLYRRRATSAP